MQQINYLKLELIKLLKSEQRADGSFIDFASADIYFNNSRERHTTFTTSLVLDNLADNDEPELMLLKKRGIKFLLNQKKECSSFNYWVKNSEEEQNMPYPNDLDDTASAFAVLHKYNKITGKDIAEFTNLLINQEEKEGGPYRTWIIEKNKKEWHDIDLAVNSNIAYFLSLLDINLPELDKYIDSCTSKLNFSSPYYFGKTPVLYFISRTNPQKKNKIIKNLLEVNPTNPLELSLITLALLNLDYENANKYINKVLSISSSNISKAYPFIIESNKNNHKIYSGSKALTISFVLNVISRIDKEEEMVTNESYKIRDKILELAKQKN